MLDDKGIESAADCLDEAGRHYHWWRRAEGVGSWRDLDPAGRSEFLGIVESIVLAYKKARHPAKSRKIPRNSGKVWLLPDARK